MTTRQLLDKVNALDTDKVINDSLDETMDAVEDINRERMLDGVKADGKMMPHYSYISRTVYGYPDEPIKLKDTGAFQAGITAKREGENIAQDSTDSKTDMLVERYGDEILGIGKGTYKKQYQDEHLRPTLNKKITAATGLKFGK